MSVIEKMQPWEPALKDGAQAQTTPNYCTFDPLIQRSVHDLEACCPHCSAYKARRAANRRRGWCSGCCGFLFKVAALVALLFIASRFFHVSTGKHWNFLGADEDPSSFPFRPVGGKKAVSSRCTENVCLKTFNFGRADQFQLVNDIKPVAACHHNYDATKNFIQILEATGAQSDDVVVEFSFNSTRPEIQQLLEIQQDGPSLWMNYPTSEPTVDTPCYGDFSSWTKIYLRKGLHLNNLNLESSVFNVEIPQPVDVQVDDINIILDAASLNANPFLDTNDVNVRTQAGSVRGTFNLHDLLQISAKTGSIAVDVIPQEEARDKEAVLDLSTQAGHINANYPPKDVPIPAREYHTSVSTDAGSIRGRYIHGKETTLRGMVGAVDAVVIPYVSSADEKSTLTTVTNSGMQRVKVLSPVTTNGGVSSLTKLDGNHTSSKGGMSIVYPPEWEGSVEAETTAGSVNLEGPGLEVSKTPFPGLGLKMTGKKGSGEGFTKCSAQLGRVSFEIGNGLEDY